MTEPSPLLIVQAQQCSTCVFGPNSPISPERFRDLREQWERRGGETYQVCHQTATWTPGEDDEDAPPLEEQRVCRGFYDEMYVRRGVPVAAIQIAERLGLLGFEQKDDQH